MKILILCTGNSCRSQMAEGILRNMDPRLEVFSAGTRPEKNVNPNAIEVMEEIGIDISSHLPKNADQFISHSFDCVITVCDNARESCPVFTGKVKHRLHIGFEDPAAARGTHDEVIQIYRKVRDQIREALEKIFYEKLIR
jgi:arsenate reductase